VLEALVLAVLAAIIVDGAKELGRIVFDRGAAQATTSPTH